MPLKGLNTINPFESFDSGFARELTNYSIHNGRLLMRPAVRNVQYNSGLGSPVHWFDVTSISGGVIAILANGNIRNLNTGAGATSVGGTPLYNATRCKHVSLDLVIGCREPRLAASPFTASTFTTLVIAFNDVRAACSHKSRLYICNANTLEYSDIAAITGAMDGTFSLAEFLDGQNILRIFSVTTTANDSENVFVIFADGGRVLVYAGEHPGSPTWYLLAKFDMPPPISNVGFVEKDGDIWVSTTEYVYWFKDLFSQGAQAAYLNSPSRPIENLWQGVKWDGDYTKNQVSHAFYYPYIDAIVCQSSDNTTGQYRFNLLADYVNLATQYVYHRKYKAWSVWLATPFYAPVLLSTDNTAYGTSANGELVVLTEGSAVDQYQGSSTRDIETSWKTPYLSPSMGKGKKLNGVRTFFQNSLTGYFHKVRAIFDYSDFNAPLGWYAQSTVTAIPPGVYQDGGMDASANTYSTYQGLIGATGVGGGFSLQFTQAPKSGSSATQSQNIHAATCYVEEGGDLF
jgi:hypothetical protein